MVRKTSARNCALSTYEQMILPYKKELEEKEVIIEQALEEARQNRARVVEQQERVRQRNIAIIKLALKYNGPINEMAQLTGLSEQEVRVIIEQMKKEHTRE